MTISVSDMLMGYDPRKPRWTIVEDYHPHIVSVSRYVHRYDPRFFALDKRRKTDEDFIRRNTFRLPYLRKR